MKKFLILLVGLLVTLFCVTGPAFASERAGIGGGTKAFLSNFSIEADIDVAASLTGGDTGDPRAILATTLTGQKDCAHPTESQARKSTTHKNLTVATNAMEGGVSPYGEGIRPKS